MAKGRKQTIVKLAAMGMAAIVLFTGNGYVRRISLQRNLAERVIRFHVLANSDSEEDQRVKLCVRDAVGGYLGEELKGADDRGESEDKIRESLPVIRQIAEKTLRENGYSYQASATLGYVDFPQKTYGGYTFPSGRYEALEIVLGEGKGHNWWCVAYPNLCFAGSVYEVVDGQAGEELREVVGDADYAALVKSGNCRVQFKYLTFLNRFLNVD